MGYIFIGLFKLFCSCAFSGLTAHNLHNYIRKNKYKETDGWISLFSTILYFGCFISVIVM